jgi:hypothetical protein
VLLVGVLTQPGGASARRDAPSVSLDGAVVTATWSQGWLKPGAAIRFRGSVDAPAKLSAILKPLDRPAIVTARLDFDVAQSGGFTETLKLPPRPLPGAYILRLVGASASEQVDPASLDVQIPAPPEGVLDKAEVSGNPDGPWLTYNGSSGPSLHGQYKDLWMRFHFLYPPSGNTVELLWTLRLHRVVGHVCRRYQDVIETHAGATSPLPVGIWKVVLKIDGRVAKQMDVRLESGPVHFLVGSKSTC